MQSTEQLIEKLTTAQKKNKLLTGLSIILFISTAISLYYVVPKKKSLSEEPMFLGGEQIKREDAQSWVNLYINDSARIGQTQAVSFDFTTLYKVIGSWENIKDKIGGYKPDQIMMKFLIYDNLITTPQYAGDPKKMPGVLSVCLYPYNKAKAKVVDDSTSASRPLDLGDLYP